MLIIILKSYISILCFNLIYIIIQIRNLTFGISNFNILFCILAEHLNYNSLFAHKYNKSYKFFHAIHILPNLAHWWYRANLSFEYLSFIPLLFLLHTVFFVHIGIHTHTHTHVCMLTCTLYSRSRRQNEHFVDLTFLICNYFPRIDFQKWYCYDKYVLFIALIL